MLKIKSFWSLFIIAAGPFFMAVAVQNVEQMPDQIETMVVFIHGTILPYPSPKSISATIFKKSKNREHSLNDKFYFSLRYNSVFRYQPIQDYGLKKIEFAPVAEKSPYYYSFISAALYKKALERVNADKYNNLLFYTFGWDGRLSKKSRINAAKKLYEDLQAEVGRIKKEGKQLKLILLGHSHGGNVILNLAKIQNETKGNLSIDTLILLGTPVQRETEKFVSDAIFKKAYSFFSKTDLFQVADALSTKDMFSKRKFDSKKSPNLAQIQIEIGGKNPEHAQLWLFGAKSNWAYKKNIAICPLPVFVFVPEIINILESEGSKKIDLKVNISKPTKDNYKIDLIAKDADGRSEPKSLTIPVNLFEF